MSYTERSGPAGETGPHKISIGGSQTSLIDGTPNLRELDDALPFGPSLYADVPDMDAFIRSTIRSAAAFIDVKKHRMGVSA